MKGVVLDNAQAKTAQQSILELGTYCGYSALRMAVIAPQAHIYFLEFNLAKKVFAYKILNHAGVANRVTVVHGILGNKGKTIQKLNRLKRLKLLPEKISCRSAGAIMISLRWSYYYYFAPMELL